MTTVLGTIFRLRLFAVERLKQLSWLPPLLARVSVGVLFFTTGWGKLHNLPKVIDFFRELGIPYPELQAPFVAGIEFSCGILITIGLLTRLASMPLSISMVVALITAKREEINGISDLFGLAEYLYIVIFVWLIISGPGTISLDWLLVRKLEKSK